MDYRRDYILRMIHMLGDLLRSIAERMDDWERARMFDTACREHCGMPFSTAQALSPDSLIALLPPLPRMAAAELLTGKADLCAMPSDEAEALKYKALTLLASLYTETPLCELRAKKLTDLKREVLALLTPRDLMNCARFFAGAECYDEMEDALFQALPRADDATREAIREEGAEMLRRAAKADERTLALCRMTASELRLSARELETAQYSHEREIPQ